MGNKITSRKLVESLDLKSGFSRRKLAKFLADRFGNEKGLADAIADTYATSPEGSTTRRGVLDLVVNLLIADDDIMDPMSNMSEEELLAEAEALVARLNDSSTSTGE